MPTALPKVERRYQNAWLDSTRWHHYRPRNDDVIVATPYKSGTTLTLNLVRRLIFLGREVPRYRELWLDARFRGPIDEVAAELEAQEHRRYIKTHLALDGLPYDPQVKYIVVGRDVRDVFMSMWNHYRNMGDDFIDGLNAIPERVGPPIPHCPDDIHAFWREWMGRGWFAWESEGYPFWGNMHHVQSWWNHRHLDNLLFVHFHDLRTDLAAQVRRIADFLDIALPEAALPGIVEALGLEAMRKEAEAHDPKFARWFFYKGSNGRWRGVLSPQELELYEGKAAATLAPDCRRWLETAEFPASTV